MPVESAHIGRTLWLCGGRHGIDRKLKVKMSVKTYSEKLKDPRWQKKRLEVLNSHEWMCEGCWSTEKTLNVHHGIYLKNKEPWEYSNTVLHCLCNECHAKSHKYSDLLRLRIAESGSSYLECLHNYLFPLIDELGINFVIQILQEQKKSMDLYRKEHGL